MVMFEFLNCDLCCFISTLCSGLLMLFSACALVLSSHLVRSLTAVEVCHVYHVIIHRETQRQIHNRLFIGSTRLEANC